MSDLDSFFARKDKKKIRGKKYMTTEDIAKRLENTEKTSSKAEVLSKKVERSVTPPAVEEEVIVSTTEAVTVIEKPTEEVAAVTIDALQPEPVVVLPLPKTEEEQWNDFKDDDTVDVSNLKITKLNIEEEEEGRCGAGDGGDEGKENSGEDKKDGVWKIEEQKSMQTVICEAVDASMDDGMQDVKATVAAMANNARWTSSMSKDLASATPLPRGSRRKKAAPDITNAAAFPTLADSKSTAGRKKAHEDMSGHGPDHRRHPHSMLGGSIRGLGNKGNQSSGSSAAVYKPPMRTSNRFDALTDHNRQS